jgi:hypothetical protein
MRLSVALRHAPSVTESHSMRTTADDNPRPLKRLRLNPDDKENAVEPQKTDAPSPPPGLPLAVLPRPELLVSLPALLVHPPSHRHYVQSLVLSLRALRTCLSMDGIDADIECRAWTAFAELAMRVIAGGFTKRDEHRWAANIEIEVWMLQLRCLCR